MSCGTPDVTDAATMAKFWARVVKTDDCWRWGAVAGYGYFKAGKLREYAHRFSWKVHHGSIPAGMCVLHRCDNPPCVNPRHLFIGTKRDNILDRNTKGRGDACYRKTALSLRGEKSRFAVLNEEKVREIRSYDGPLGINARIRMFAKKFGVAYSTVSFVHYRYTWKHI